MKKLTPAIVRKEIAKKYAGVEFFRSPSGYYYFTGESGIDIPSLYWFNLEPKDLPVILAHVAEHFPKKA